MGLHENAWSGIDILVFGATPTLPMRLELALGKVSPANEVRVTSFEKYEDAYDYCKDKSSVGLIFILENCGNSPFSGVFSQLSGHYEARGWPCFGVLLHEGEESFSGLRFVKRESRIIDYISTDSILAPDRCFESLTSIWTRFITSFESHLIPIPLQESILSVASEAGAAESNAFLRRVSMALSANLNISWVESIALAWAPMIRAVNRHTPSVLAPHVTLKEICLLAGPAEQIITDLDRLMEHSGSLCSRIFSMASYLERLRNEGRLENGLLELSSKMKPGAPALLKAVVRQQSAILEIQRSLESGFDKSVSLVRVA